MHFQAALSIAIFGASALADAPQPRQNSCVMCPEVMPECPVCPANEDCVISNPSDCTECPQAYCATRAADGTPTSTPTGIIGGSSTSTSTTDGGFTLPTVSESETSTGTASSTTTATESSGSTTATATASEGSSTGTASAPGASSSAPSSSAAGRGADVAGVVGVALLMAVPVLGLQGLW
ncbi:hypothetical protein INS49_012902 [Diaporthe citri]|uniref:uncharacterized protein n=1 Tax=Diaporthe citri TaxID=83186 RepID=UPI001C7FCD54|nr:uncharacterized protein INS49_012902 [Diaporthe citri]KAG6359381.1 hypothetical protein INS49_012902 [Diaporthe citri]